METSSIIRDEALSTKNKKDKNHSSLFASDKFDAVPPSIGSKRVFNVVNVFYIDRLRQQDFAVPPFFKEHLENVVFEEGKVVQFRCSIGGCPVPEVEWYKGSNRITEAKDEEENLGDCIGYKYYATKEQDNLFLVISNVLTEDFGPYTCKLRNIVGEASSTALLYALPETEIDQVQKGSDGERRKIILEETITVVERKPLFTDARSDFYMTSNNYRKEKGESSVEKMDEEGSAEDAETLSEEQLMTVMFALPNACETRNLQITTYKGNPGLPVLENDILFQNGFSTRISETDSSYHEDLVNRSVKTNEDHSQTITLENETKGAISPGCDGDMQNIVQWIQCGELSDSEYRRNSIPYPLPQTLTEAPDESVQLDFSQTPADDVTTPGNKNEWVSSWQRKGEVEEEEDGSEGESKDTVGGECGSLFSRGVFQFPNYRADSEDRSEFTDVFEDDGLTSPRTGRHHQQTLDLSNDDGNVATLHDFSPLSPDSNGLRLGKFEQDPTIKYADDVAEQRTPDGSRGSETAEMTLSIAVEEQLVEPCSEEQQSCEPTLSAEEPFTETPSTDTAENRTIEDSQDFTHMQRHHTSFASPMQQHRTEADPTKTLDELIDRLLEFSQSDYVLVSTLRVARSRKKSSHADVIPPTSSADQVSFKLGDNDDIVIQPTKADGVYNEPYRVQKMNDVPMHPSDLAAEGEDEPHKPKFVIPLEDMVVDSADNIVLNVSVTGFPAPLISWFKDGHPLSDANTGEIVDDLKCQSATYTCVAKNSSGEAVTSAIVTVQPTVGTGETAVESPQANGTKDAVKLRQKKNAVPEEVRRSLIVSASLVDYLRSKARSLKIAETEDSTKDSNQELARSSEPVGAGLTRDDVTLRHGSMLSLNSMATTTSFESADETLASSDAVWEEVVSTCEEDFMSTDEFFFPELNHDNLEGLKIRSQYGEMDSDDELFTPRPHTPTPVSEKPPFEYEITPTRSSKPFTRTSTEPFIIVPGSSEDMETAPSNSATPVPPGDKDDLQMFTEVETRHPKFLAPLKDSDIVLGCTCAITCCVLGNPEPVVAWYRNGIRILPPGPDGKSSPRSFLTSFPSPESNTGTPSMRFKIMAEERQDVMNNDKTVRYTMHTLTISDCRLTDAGEYSVTAVNVYGNEMCKAHIDVKEEGEVLPAESVEFVTPKFVTKTTDSDGMLGGEASMTFELLGQPEPDITVFHNKEEAEGEKYFLTKDDNGRYILTISDLRIEDEGEVRVCAMNVVGYAECASELFVDERTVTPTPERIPQWSDHPEDIDFGMLDIREQLASQSIAPYFDDIADDVITEPGGEANFAVRVYAWPAPDVYWYKNDEKVLNAGRFSIECTDFGTHVLKIQTINESDAGIYTCVAKNSIGQVSCKAELTFPGFNMSDQSSDDEGNKEIDKRRFKDHYTVCANLRTGSFSAVRLVRRNENDTTHVAKYIRCVKAEWRDRLLNEVRILKKLSNENIAAFRDYFETKKHIILVMENAEREWFEFLLDSKDTTEKEIGWQVRQLCSGLQYLHENMVVHLDMAPENIMIREKTIKIVDFGSARELKDDEDVFWEYGNPEFVSPEVVDSRPVIPASDMWSLGVVVFVAISGNTPFLAENDCATVLQVRAGKYVFDKRGFASASDEAIDFIRKLIVLEASSRLSAVEAQSHNWLQQPQTEEKSPPLSEGKLKYFCSRRKWQRSLVGPKTSLTLRSIPSLLRQEYDSASVAVPRNLMSECLSSSTVTESEDDTDSAAFESAPTSPKLRFDVTRRPPPVTERAKRQAISSISIEDMVEQQKDRATAPTVKVTVSSPKSSPEYERKNKADTQTNVGDGEQEHAGDSKSTKKSRNKALRLLPLNRRDRLKIIGKKVSFDDEPSSITEAEGVESPVFLTAAEEKSSPPIVPEEVEAKDLPPVAQMPEVTKPNNASCPPGIILDRPKSVSKLLKEDRKSSKPRRTTDTESQMSTKEKIKKKLSLRSLRRHRSYDTRSLSSSSDDEGDSSRHGRQSQKKDTSTGKSKFSFFNRRKRPVTKGSSLDSSTGPPEEKKLETTPPVTNESPTPPKSPIKSILKRGVLSDASSQSDSHLQKSLEKPRSPDSSLSANMESFFGPKKYQKRPLAKGMSLDLDMVAEKSDSSNNKGEKSAKKAATGRRRPQLRRGSSVESALPSKARPRLSGLRGPLLEKGAGDDEPTAGMSLRRSMPAMNKGAPLPNHARSYSGPLGIPSPSFSTGRRSPVQLSPRVPSSAPYRQYSSLQRSFFSQSVDISSAKLPDTVQEDDFKGRKAQSAQLPISGISFTRSRSQDRPIGRRGRSADRRPPGENYAPYLKTPLINQGLTHSQTYVTLSCLIDAFPQPEVTWYKDGNEINASDRIGIISEPSISRYQLNIRNLSLPSDFGRYSCEAKNFLGTVKTDCHLQQAVSPDKPSAPEFSGTDGRNVWITWNPPTNCAASPMSYILQYREMAAMKWVVVDTSIKDTLYKVENLRSTTSYRFRVRAVNNVGVGPFSKVSQRIQIDPKATIQALQYAF